MTEMSTLAPYSTAGLIRNEPVQARSTARLAALLDAAAQVIDEIGFERLTTAMVAERAGASIGTVYRYFPDRIAVLQSLAARSFERLVDRAILAIRESDAASPADALDHVYDAVAEAFRTEPGYASLRIGEVIDLRPSESEPAFGVFTDRLLDALVRRFKCEDGDTERTAIEAALVVGDAMLARAFSRDPKGDRGWIDRGRESARAMVAPYYS